MKRDLNPAPLSDVQATELFEAPHEDWAAGAVVAVPTWALLETCNDAQLRGLHDAFVTGSLENCTSKEWRSSHPGVVAAWKDRMTQPGNSPSRRDIAWYFRREVDQRDADARERRMEFWTIAATLFALTAILVTLFGE